MKKVSLKGASWDSMFLTFVRVITMFTTIITTKILSVGLSLSEYGTYSQANLVVSIGTSILMFGLGDALNYFYNNKNSDESDRYRIVNTIFAAEVVMGVIFFAVVVLARDLIAAYFSNAALKALLALVAFRPMLDNLVYFYQILYVSTGKAKIIAVRNLVVSLLKVAIIYLSVYFLKSIVAIFAALLLIDILQLVFFKLFFAKDSFMVNPFKIQADSIRKIFAFAAPMGVYAFTNLLLRDVDKLVIGRLADVETLAVYTNCSKVLPFDIFATSFSTVLIPIIMKFVSAKDTENTVHVFSSYLKVSYYTVWLFGAAVLAVPSQALEFLYSSEYLSGIGVFVLYIFESMIRFGSIHIVLTARGKAKTLMSYSVIALLVNTVLNILLYWWVGIIGPAIATVMTSFGILLLIIHRTNKELSVKWTQIFNVKDIIRSISFYAVSACVAYGVNYAFLHIGLHKYISMIISMGITVLLGFALNHKNIMSCLKDINRIKTSA